MLVGLKDGGGASSFAMWLFHGIESPEPPGDVEHVPVFLLPTTRAAANAETPADIWTTSPPAKSMDPKAFSQPSGFQTQ